MASGLQGVQSLFYSGVQLAHRNRDLRRGRGLRESRDTLFFLEDILSAYRETRYLYLGNSKPPDCGRGQNLHGRTRTLDGQCLYRTAVRVIQVPGRPISKATLTVSRRARFKGISTHSREVEQR